MVNNISQSYPAGHVLRDRYQISQFFGSGGFGHTYLARDLHLPNNPNSVVKHLQPKNTSPYGILTAQRLFDREAKTLYHLGSKKHPQIPNLLAHFPENGNFFLFKSILMVMI
jgi:serine/threonine protein kinase